MSWATHADQVLAGVFADLPGGATDLDRRLRDAYPFGVRKYSPYKTWLRRVKVWRAAYAAGLSRPMARRALNARREVHAPEQGRLF